MCAGAGLEQIDHEGSKPVHVAARYGQHDVLQLLLRNGAHPERYVVDLSHFFKFFFFSLSEPIETFLPGCVMMKNDVIPTWLFSSCNLLGFLTSFCNVPT